MDRQDLKKRWCIRSILAVLRPRRRIHPDQGNSAMVTDSDVYSDLGELVGFEALEELEHEVLAQAELELLSSGFVSRHRDPDSGRDVVTISIDKHIWDKVFKSPTIKKKT